MAARRHAHWCDNSPANCCAALRFHKLEDQSVERPADSDAVTLTLRGGGCGGRRRRLARGFGCVIAGAAQAVVRPRLGSYTKRIHISAVYVRQVLLGTGVDLCGAGRSLADWSRARESRGNADGDGARREMSRCICDSSLGVALPRPISGSSVRMRSG